MTGMAVGDIITRSSGPDRPELGSQGSSFKLENCKGISFEGLTTNIIEISPWGGDNGGNPTCKNCHFINGPNQVGDSVGLALGVLQSNPAWGGKDSSILNMKNTGGSMYQAEGSRDSLTAI